MSSTKLVIIVLVLIGLLFVIFVLRGGLRHDPEPSKTDRKADAEKQQPPDWTKKIEGLFSSLKPKRALEKKTYSSSTTDTIQPDAKQPFRTVKFHLISGGADIDYDDKTPIESKDLQDLKSQHCPLPGAFKAENPKADLSLCSIVALKGGGTVRITCTGTSGCRVEVQ